MLRKKLLAFTLAEVIIVVGIIGIVAELTIPGLVKDYEKQIIVTKVKEIYSILNQANLMLNSDCDRDIINCLTNSNAADDNVTARADLAKLYKQKLSVFKDCTDNSSGCFYDGQYKDLDGHLFFETGATSFVSDSALLLKNGTAICFDWDGANYSPRYFRIYVDINGPKPPNQWGKDTFEFVYNYNNKTIKPWDGKDCSVSNSGWGCANVIIQESAINYY